jgi:DNA recombination-dependent growth factor C
VKAIKAFTPLRVTTNHLYDWCRRAAKSNKTADVIELFLAKDPASHAWNSMGLIPPFEQGRPVHDLDGAAYLLAYQFNDRILPGPVRDEKMVARIAALREKEERDPTKQEYAQIRDEVERELLPVAFIRRTHIPVLVYKDKVLICTPAAKKVTDIVAHLTRLMTVREIEGTFELVWTKEDIAPTLKKCVLEESLQNDESDFYFEASDAAVFKGADKRTLTIKNRSMSRKEIQSALVEGSYDVTALKMDWMNEDGESLAAFMLTDKWVVKSIKLAETVETKSAEDAHATFYIFARQLGAMHEDIVATLGGYTHGPASDEDEEL